jgi:CspA family cold shock protein
MAEDASSTGVVVAWNGADGLGVIESPDTPGGCWCGWMSITMDRFVGRFDPGTQVEFTYEAVRQDGYDYRAIDMWIPGHRAPRPEPIGGSTGYRSTLKITCDDGSSEQS